MQIQNLVEEQKEEMEKASKESKEDGEEVVQSFSEVPEAKTATIWNSLVQISSSLSTLFQSPKGPMKQEVIEFKVPIPTNKVLLIL